MASQLRIVEVGPETEQQWTSMLETYPYNDFRRYPSLGDRAAAKYLEGVVSETLARQEVKSWLGLVDEKPAGLILLSPLAWDTDFFGIPMARLTFLGAPAPREEVYRAADQLLEVALATSRDSQIEHLSIRVDVEDIAAVHALEKHGFRLMDTLFTYAFHPKKCRLPELEHAYDVRTFSSKDQEAVMEITATAFDGYLSRFSVDPHIPSERALALYLEWAKKCCQGELADEMLVAERKGKVIGYLGWRRHRDLERLTGVRIDGGGLGACYPRRFNAYIELLREAARRALTQADATDSETQSFNMATASFYQQLDFRYVRAKYAFHCWLGALQ